MLLSSDPTFFGKEEGVEVDGLVGRRGLDGWREKERKTASQSSSLVEGYFRLFGASLRFLIDFQGRALTPTALLRQRSGSFGLSSPLRSFFFRCLVGAVWCFLLSKDRPAEGVSLMKRRER